jgi:plasmid stabilization system protein ParE
MIIRWTRRAVDDLTHICDYTEKRLGAAQARWAAMIIYEAADALKEMPFRGRSGRKAGTRELTIRMLPFLIVYRAGPEAVEVVRVLHGSQRP